MEDINKRVLNDMEIDNFKNTLKKHKKLLG